MRHHKLRNILISALAEKEDVAAGSVSFLDAEKEKHFKKVLRIQDGEKLRVVDGRGKAYLALFVDDGERTGVRIEELLESQQVKGLELVVCLPKNSTMDALIEKAVECGVTAISPVVSTRSVVRVNPAEKKKYTLRWQKIMDEAVEQSERTFAPVIEEPKSWKEFISTIKTPPASFAFISELRESGKGLEIELFRETFLKLIQMQYEPVRILIGPEGGLTDEERTDLKTVGFTEASLGENVLRVETAVTAALSMVQLSRVLPKTR